jgi:hypothetical protein
MKTFPVLTSALCLLALTSSGFAQTGGDTLPNPATRMPGSRPPACRPSCA